MAHAFYRQAIQSFEKQALSASASP
ncbi:hypothetical protein AZE42_08517 [Rhizopogon vesiculosus]|uniref:Uncharacterized protein n=1 Tax=Rhizopogon vesiculosus TaxID=180088 RepID=A0A1J8Q1D4_9AGAM|nr:hypothetical protein AZE42_08517 [Rhizopogon vesiculosus]